MSELGVLFDTPTAELPKPGDPDHQCLDAIAAAAIALLEDPTTVMWAGRSVQDTCREILKAFIRIRLSRNPVAPDVLAAYEDLANALVALRGLASVAGRPQLVH